MIRHLTLALVALAFAAGAMRAEGTKDVVEVTLNGLTITIDKQTGSIIGLDYSGPGKMLSASPDIAGIVDLAYPIPEFAPLRLASRFSKGAQIEKSENAVVISWENLGASRTYFQPAGKVSARVWIQRCPMGAPVSMKCQIVNAQSGQSARSCFLTCMGSCRLPAREETYLRTPGLHQETLYRRRATVYPEFYAVEGGVTGETPGVYRRDKLREAPTT